MSLEIGKATRIAVLPAAMLFVAFVLNVNAQVQSTTSTTSGQSTQEVSVERGEVVHVSGNDVVVKMEDGSLRDFHHVSEGAKVNVGGQELGVHDLKPGMKLEKTITVTTTPQTITTVKKVTGKVWHVSPPKTVVLTLEDGTQQQFTIPEGQKFNIDGQEVDAFHLKKGMRITATKVIEEPVITSQQQTQLSGSMPPPPPAPEPDVPMLIAVIRPVPMPASPAVTPAATSEELPKTGSMLPWIGLIGALLALCGFVLRAIRLSRSS